MSPPRFTTSSGSEESDSVSHETGECNPSSVMSETGDSISRSSESGDPITVRSGLGDSIQILSANVEAGLPTLGLGVFGRLTGGVCGSLTGCGAAGARSHGGLLEPTLLSRTGADCAALSAAPRSCLFSIALAERL